MHVEYLVQRNVKRRWEIVSRLDDQNCSESLLSLQRLVVE